MILFPWSFCVQLHLLAQNSTVGVNLRAEIYRNKSKERVTKIYLITFIREGFLQLSDSSYFGKYSDSWPFTKNLWSPRSW